MMGVCIDFVDEQLYGGEMSIDAGEVAKAKLADAGAAPATSTGAAPLATEPPTKSRVSLPTGKS